MIEWSAIALDRDPAACQRDGVLSCGRRARLRAQCWLETYSEDNEVFALVVEGRVGLRPAPPDGEERRDPCLRSAPIIVRLGPPSDPHYGHWIPDAADVYFYTWTGLENAFRMAPVFACEIIDLWTRQYAAVMAAGGRRSDQGLARLIHSLVVRAGTAEEMPAKLSVTQLELAFETGLSRQWVNHLLRQLEQRGVARTGRGYVVLRSAAALKNML